MSAVPSRTGTCEYCLRRRTVYAYILWACQECLADGPQQQGEGLR